ncbi:hypothetical protein [Desertivirga arenae]|uniref:hypothetical protein n=1 Tax=Desertivirga arenae TaxID=2810309 RepID=UPI001A97001A|nr:hypothetical protein [Pedobacter sp. SYSU D00823]
MKKNRKLKKKKEELTTVKSNTYGEHQRAKRGTYTEVSLNDKMKKSSEEQGLSNIDASLIRKELLPYFYNTKPRNYWPRLLSLTRAGYKGGSCLDPSIFINIDVYEEYKLNRLASPLFNINSSGDVLTVKLEWSQSPNFNRKFPDGYLYGVLCIFIDRTNIRSASSVKYSEVYSLQVNKGSCSLDFDLPTDYQYALVFLILHPTEKNKVYTGAASSGFKCIWASSLKDQSKVAMEELVISDITSA